jgi:transposase
MSFRGKKITTEFEELIVQLKKHYDKERKSGDFVSTKDPTGRTARALGLGTSTVKRIMARYTANGGKVVHRSTRKPGRPPQRIIKNAQPFVRQFIRTENLYGKRVSLERVRQYLKSEHRIDVPKMTLWRALNRWGFSYGEGSRRENLKEKDHVILARRKYLRIKRANRNPDGSVKRPEVYVDETYINKNHSSRFTWFLEEDGPWVHKPAGVGPRLIVVHAMTKDGWVDGAERVFEAKKRTGDYHGQMNWDNFSKWFLLQLVKNIPPEALVILDNAPYHNVVDSKYVPQKSSTKAQLKSWLDVNNYPWREDMLKSELLDVCRRVAPKPQFCLDQLAEEHNISILRTPPYHPELQPIESCWAVVKNYMADNCDFTMKGMRERLPEAFSKVSPQTCKKIIAKVVQQEDKYWQEDEEIDEKLAFHDERLPQQDGLEHYLDEL